jgi:hypothetical protein
MEALADVGATWVSWGGGWSGADAVHFELPGASAWAVEQGKQQSGGAVGETVRSWADWFTSLPWYAALLVPTSLLYSTEPIPESRFRNWLRSKGISF